MYWDNYFIDIEHSRDVINKIINIISARGNKWVFFTGAKVWLSFIKINPESKIWNKHCLEIWYFFLLNKHNGVCTAYSFLTWKPPGLVCYIYDITGNDVHFVLDIKTVHLHRPFPCVSPQNFIAFCIDFLGCSSIGTNQNNWVSMVLRKLRFELHVQLSIFE